MESTQNEAWAAIPDFEGRYEVSSAGRVRTCTGRIKATRTLPGGHRYVELWKNNQRARLYVHRLVICAFGSAPKIGEEVRHISGNPSDNRIENLQWGSRSENMMDEVHAGRHWQTRKTHCKHGHEFTPENTFMHHRAGKNPSRVCRICRRASQAKNLAKVANR